MKLYSELVSWDHNKAQKWANNMKLLVDLLSQRTISFLDKLSTPLRPELMQYCIFILTYDRVF